jgi:hypothetical protein
MNMRLAAIVFGVLALVAGAAAQTFSFHIENPPGASQFRIGEAISLKVIVEMNSGSDVPTPGPPDWMMTLQAHDRSVLGLGRDRFVVSPLTGTRDPWSYRLHEGIVFSGLVGAFPGAKPVVFDVDLNQWVRFERAGHYTVYGLSHVTGPQHQDVEVKSNEIAVDIVAADPEWQSQELARDIAILNSTQSKTDSQSFEARMSAARRLTYLDTPAAVREMARRLGTADIQTAQILQDGLRSSQHSLEALVDMKDFLRSPSEPVPPIFLRTFAALDKNAKQPQAVLTDVIDEKQGAAKAISIKTLLDGLPADRVPAKMRSEIARLFPDLPTSQQSELLNSEWEKIDSPGMIPVLRDICEAAPQSRYPENPLFASAVERLYELEPGRTRTLLLEEMKRPDPRLPYHTLAMLPDVTLPELDAIFVENLRHNGGRPVEELISRYATASIADAVKEFYAKRDAAMRSRVTPNLNIAAPACEPPLVAYFLRTEPGWGEKVLRRSLAERSYPMGRCWLGIIGQTAKYYSGPVWEKVAIEALRDPAVPVKTDAVKSLAQHGSPGSKPAIFDAFRYWREWWESRGEPNDENRRLEQAFVEATTRSRNWSPSGADLGTARDLCLSASCKAQVPRPQN